MFEQTGYSKVATGGFVALASARGKRTCWVFSNYGKEALRLAGDEIQSCDTAPCCRATEGEVEKLILISTSLKP